MKMKFSVALSLAASALALPSASDAAIIVPSSACAGSTPDTSGNGLAGSYWSGYGQSTTIAKNIANVSNVLPTATFTATAVNYPNGKPGSFSDSHSLSQFLGVDATSIVGANSASLSHSVAEFTGYIDIPAAGSYTFGVGSDDGMELLIGGKTIAEYSSQRGYGVTEGTASFSQAGLYPITLWYYEYGGKTGVSLLDGAGNVIPQSDLYTAVSSGSPSPTIPEPALLGYGATGLLLLTRRRKE